MRWNAQCQWAWKINLKKSKPNQFNLLFFFFFKLFNVFSEVQNTKEKQKKKKQKWCEKIIMWWMMNTNKRWYMNWSLNTKDAIRVYLTWNMTANRATLNRLRVLIEDQTNDRKIQFYDSLIIYFEIQTI